MSDSEAAGFHVSYQTAHFALVHRAHIKAGETLLVHAGAGALGLAAIQIAKALGATVIATSGSDQKVDVCMKAGADLGINYSHEDFVGAVLQATGERGADIVLDPVGGDVFSRSLRCIAWEGRILPVGFTGGEISSVQNNRVLLKNISVIGLWWSEYWNRDTTLVRQIHDELAKLFTGGKIRPIVSNAFPMEQLPDALDAIMNRRTYGKVILQIR